MSTLRVSEIDLNDAGNASISISNSWNVSVSAGGAERLKVDTTGRVQVHGDLSSNTITTRGIFRAQSVAGTGFIDVNHDGTNGSLVNNTGSFLFYAEGSNSLIFHTNATQRGVFDGSGNFQFNSGYGSVATAYGCRAWVNFNGTGVVAIRASGNITSITDNGTGDYTLNFTTAMPDANYSITGGSSGGYGTNGLPFSLYLNATLSGTESAPATSSCRFLTSKQDGLFDAKYINVAIFR
jgi:hypothetical protein